MKYPCVRPRCIAGEASEPSCAVEEARCRQAVQWVRGIQGKADRDAAKLGLVVESFIPGREHALEELLQDGRLRVLALFDKPDPLDGPYFEETLYVTPSRLPQAKQDEILVVVSRARAWP